MGDFSARKTIKRTLKPHRCEQCGQMTPTPAVSAKEKVLLPCPFCGGPARTFRLNGTEQATCAASVVDYAGSDVSAPVAMWNRRASSPAAGGLEAVLSAYEAETRALPLGAASREKGDSAYNWRMSVVKDLRKLAARLASPAATSAETQSGDGVREGLIDSINQAETYLSQHIETYHDYEDDTPERASLRGIQHHLIGSLIADDGSFLAPAVESAQVKEALDVAREYVVDGLSAQDQKRRDVEGYPGLMKREQGRLDEVRADLALVDRIRASLATAEG